MTAISFRDIYDDLTSAASRIEIAQKCGILVFAFGVWSLRAIAVIGMLLLMVGAFGRWQRTKRYLLQSGSGILAMVLAGYIVISAIAFALIFGEHAKDMLGEGLRLIYLCGFVFFALALADNRKYLGPTIALSIIGFFVTRSIYLPDLIASSDEWWTARHALGFPTAIPMGQSAFAVLLGLIIFAPRILNLNRNSIVVLWVLAIVLAIQFVTISQTRSVWLSAPVFLIATLSLMLLYKVAEARVFTWIFVALTASTVTVAALQYSTIEARLTTESETWSQLAEGEISAIPSTREGGQVKSIGIRVNMLEFGIEKWLERPVFGWGPGATKMLIECCAPESFQRFNDLHSAYPEILLRLGLIGALLILALNIFLARDAIGATRRGELPRDILLFVAVCVALHWVVAIANFRLLNYDWRFYWIFFAGIAMAFSLRESTPRDT